MNTARLALRLLGREWRSSELRVLALALIIAVASLSSVNFFTSRIHQILEGQASNLLGGDLLLLADHPIRKARRQQAMALGLLTAETVELPATALAGERNHLVALKAVSDGYPLRGRNRTADRLFAPDSEVEGGPTPGTVWAGSRLLTLLGIDVGDEITLGASRFSVAAVLTSEPDQSEGVLFNIAPRLLMHKADLPRTGLLQPGSIAQFRLLMAGEASRIARLRAEMEPRLATGEVLHDVMDARPEVRSALARGEAFLSLAALVSVLLAGAAVAMAARRFVQRHLDDCAVLRCIGAEQPVISQLYGVQMLTLGIVASLIGVALGYLAQEGLVALLAPLAGIKLPSPSAWPVFSGFSTGLITLLGFAIPPVLQLKDVPTLRVLNRDLGQLQGNTLAAYAAAVGAFVLLVALQAQDLKMALSIVAGLLLVLVLLGLLSWLLLLLLRPLREHGGVSWRFGLVNISRRSGHSLIQTLGFSIGLMALLLLGVVRTDLLQEWENRLPADIPNRFLINIQADQLEPLKLFFEDEQLQPPRLSPMLRARLTGINNAPVSPEDFETRRARRLVQREFNLSWSDRIQPGNEVVSGQWWEARDRGEALLSVEQGLADELGLKIGDSLTYDIGGQRFTAIIHNLRKVNWENFRANFFVVTPPGTLDEYPVSYITGFFVSESQQVFLDRLLQKFPNITLLDVATILNQIREIIDRVTLAVEYVFLFTLGAGLMVMYAAIHATLDERIREIAILRTIGARHGQLLSGLAIEYAGIGLLAGLVAAITAGFIGMVLAERVFQLTYIPGPGLWLGGTLVGAIGIGIAGTLGTRSTLHHPPLETLRRL